MIPITILLVWAICLCFPATADEPARRPNILIIFTDDQVYRAIGYNNPQVVTPHLDELSRQGVIFDHAYVASPICVASRASTLTGLFPLQIPSVGLDASGFRERVVNEGELKTVAHYLTETGYVTGFCGKSHLRDPQKYGFREGTEHGRFDDQPAFDFAAEFVRNRARDQKPFFLWVAPKQPHVPLLPDHKWIDLYADVRIHLDPNFRTAPPTGSLFNQGLPGEQFYRDSDYTRNYKDLPGGPPRSESIMRDFIKAYYATISHLDQQVGDLVRQLKQSHLYQQTLIIYLSDNDYFLGNHGLGNKITMHEESVRVPMFVSGPGVKSPGTRSKELVSSLDVLPTILHVAGVPVPDHAVGKSLVGLLADPHAPIRDYVASECIGVGGKPGTGHRMIRTKRWKYMLSGVNEEALYNEQTDVHGQVNLANFARHRQTLYSMRKTLATWMDRVGDQHARPPAPKSDR